MRTIDARQTGTHYPPRDGLPRPTTWVLDEEVGRWADLLRRIRDAVQLDLAHAPVGVVEGWAEDTEGIAELIGRPCPKKIFHPA